MFQCCYSALGGNIFLGWFLKEGWGQLCSVHGFGEDISDKVFGRLEVSIHCVAADELAKGWWGVPQTQPVVWVQEEPAPDGCKRSSRQGSFATSSAMGHNTVRDSASLTLLPTE